jgi:hypothetical protein
MTIKVTPVLRMVPMVAAMGTIFFLSHQSGDNLPDLSLPGTDKLAHLAVYSLLAGTVLFSFCEELKSHHHRTVMFMTIVICVLYGITDEFHQSFIPGRFVSILDIVADCAGAVTACVLWEWWRKRRCRVSVQ